MTLSLKLNENEIEIIRNYAKSKNQTISEVIRSAVIEKIEDEIDLIVYEEAMEEHLKNPQPRTFDQVWKAVNDEI